MSISPTGLCNCSIRTTDSLQFKPCGSSATIVQKAIPSKSPNKVLLNSYVTVFEVFFKHDKKEYVHVNCSHPDNPSVGFLFGMFAFNWRQFTSTFNLENSQSLTHFYEQVLRNHEMSLASGGYLNTILIERDVFQRLGEELSGMAETN